MILKTGEIEGRSVAFLLGRAGAGKSHRAITGLLACEARGEPAFYLVPEQSTYLADRQILESGGPEAIRHARVLSFRRLAHLLEDRAARGVGKTLDASGRRILLRALFAQLDPEMRKPFESLIDRPGFIESLAAMLREIRFEAGPDGIARLDALEGLSGVGADLLRKLRMLTALRRAYDDALARRDLRDPDLVLCDAPARIRARSSPFNGKPFYVDGFLSFTRLEVEILIALAQAGAAVTICLCLDPELTAFLEEVAPPPPAFRISEWPAGVLARVAQPVFLAPLRTLAEIRGRFHAAGLSTAFEALPLQSPRPGAPAPRFRSSPGLAALEARILRASGAPGARERSGVELAAARDPAHEVETWARWIDDAIRLRNAPVRPGEIAIIVRDLEMYRPIVEETFARFHIPVFVDRHWDITARPLVRTILDALEVLRGGWQRESVVAFLRSPLLGLRGGEVDLLENLSLEGGYDFERWTGEPWPALRWLPRTRYVRAHAESGADPADGDENPEEDSSESEEDGTMTDPRLDRIERIRAGIANRIRAGRLEPLRALEEAWVAGRTTARIPGKDAVAALRRWIDASGLEERALAASDRQDALREREAVDHVLTQVADETAAEPLALEPFTRLVLAGLGSLRLGRTPTGLDRVTLAEVQRSRLGDVRLAIVGGLSARDFPRTAASERFLNERERDRLAGLGLPFGTPDPMRQEEESYFLYIALTRASERILLTRPATDLEGKSLEPSPFLKEIQEALPGLVESVPPPVEDPAQLQPVRTAEDLAARVGAYIAGRLDRRRAGRRTDPEPGGAAGQDRRILTAYNRLLLPGPAPRGVGRVALERASRLWGYENRPVLPEGVVRLALGGPALVTSVRRLETYARCPYQHYAEHMLHLKPRPRAEVTPIENGLLAHRALEVLFGEGPLPSDRRVIEGRLKQVFERIRDEEDLRAYQVDPSGRFRWRSARGRLLRFLAVESQRLERTAFHPDRFEADFGTEKVRPLTLPLPGGSELLLRGRIDRIDVAESGRGRDALVIDYKSSAPSGRGRPADVEEGLDLQLAVYLLVVEEILGMRAVGALYAPVLPGPGVKAPREEWNPLDIRLAGLVPREDEARVTGGLALLRRTRGRQLETHEDLSVLLDRAKETLRLYAGALLRGCIDIAPVKRTPGARLPCEHCDFHSVCRFDEAYNPTRRSPRGGADQGQITSG